MGLDMYILSLPRYPNHDEQVAPKTLMKWINAIEEVDIMYNHHKRELYLKGNVVEAEHIPDEIPEYDSWTENPPFSRDCFNFYRDKYVLRQYQPKEWEGLLTNGVYTEIQYWRKAYTLADEFLNKFYDNIDEDACSRELTRQDILDLQDFVNDELVGSIHNVKKGQVIGYINKNNRHVWINNAKTILLKCEDVPDEIEVPIEQPLYVEIPFEYLAEIEDNWELLRLLEAKKMCEELLSNFDFENNFLVYVASF